MSYVDIFRHIDEKQDHYEDRIVCLTNPDYDAVSNFKWNNCVGYEFEYSYQGLTGKLKITDVFCKRGHQTKLTLYFYEYDKNMEIHVIAFRDVRFGDILRIHYYEYKVGETVKNKEILGVCYDNKKRCLSYKYRCLNDGYVSEIPDNKLRKSMGKCPVCLGQIVLQGVNDIPTTDPWMVPYFIGGKEEASKYTHGSAKRILLQCPDCGRQKEMVLAKLFADKTIYCRCGDKTSFPEKYMIQLLEYLKIDFVYQCGKKTLGWIPAKYSYDFYIPEFSMIIETHGAQHYEEASEWSKWNPLKDVRENDNYKRTLAKANGIANYIEIDCRKSQGSWIKKSIMNSNLPFLFSFSEEDIDWSAIEIRSTKNKVKEICEYKSSNQDVTLSELSTIFGYSKSTISKYLKIGKEYNWYVAS